MKYLIWLLVLLLGYGWWRSKTRLQMREKKSSPVVNPVEAPVVVMVMVGCAHCGLHLPQTEALVQGPHYYCCLEHQHQHQQHHVRP